MENSNAQVSIVVPIFNVEEYVTECIASILSQSYENIEVILVNDGSTDSSGTICDSFAKGDKRITVIHKKNGGLSDARNAGINMSTGYYVAFVDGDDFVADDYIKTLLDLVVKSDSDIGCSGYYAYFQDGSKKLSSNRVLTKYKNFTSVEAIEDIFSLRSSLKVATWNKIYKMDLFKHNGVTFPVGMINEDNLTTYKLMFFARKISFVNLPLVYYRQRSGSIMRRKITYNDFVRRGDMITETNKWLEEKRIKNRKRIIRKYKNTMFVLLLIDMFKNFQFKFIGKLCTGYLFTWGRN